MIKIYSFLILAIVFASNVIAQNIPSYVPKNGLVGYWPFNGNANDESGNGNHGTVNGATLTADRNGKVNSSYSFNGVSDFITCPLNVSSYSISFWIYSDQLTNQFSELYYYNDSYSEILQSNNSVYVRKQNSNNQNNKELYSASLIPKNWHHIYIYYDQSVNTLNCKINNQNFYSSSIVSGGAANNLQNNLLYLGARGWNNTNFYKGQIDDITIYNRALTDQEITSLYTGNTITEIPSYVPKNGLVGWWPFNGNANDESGNGNHGTVGNGINLDQDRNNNSNSSYYFSGVDNIKLNKYSIKNQVNFTISVWIKSKYQYNLNGNRNGIISIGSKTIDNAGLHLYYYNGATNFDLTNIFGIGNSKIVSDNFWHNLIVTNQDGKIMIFVDGISDGNSKMMTPNISETDLNEFGSASACCSTDYFIGNLDDIAIYNRALTQQEITALYTGTPQAGLASTKVFVDAPATVNQNETLELSISTETLNTSDNVISFQTDFNYDTTRYTYVGNNVVGTLNPNGTVDVNTAKKGLIKLGYMSQTALSGAGSLVKLKFKANDKVGQGIFGLSNFLFNTTNITSLKSDTVNTLDVTPPTAKLTYSLNPARKGDSLLITVNFSEKMAVSPVPQINLTGQNTLANSNLTKVNDSTYTYWWVVEKGNGAVNVNLATGTDLAGNVIIATPTQNPSFTVLPTVFGDIDTNKLVQAYDAALALQYSVGLNPLPTMDPLPWSNWRLAVANVDTVGSVTANDASLILQHSIGKISSFPADAKKRGGEAPTADVTVKREGNQLVFRTTGTLYAFNGYFKDNFNAFGQPEIKDKNAMVATNINATTYNVGLASSTPFTVNEPFLIIPILATTDIAGTIDIVANTQEKALTYNSAAVASINEAMTTTMNVYPNPTKDVVTVTNAQGKTLRIVDFQGRIVSTQAITNNTHEVSLKSIGSKGEYIFQLLGENDETITTQKVVMQ